MTVLESDLKRLPEPALPKGLTEAIMARVARLDEKGGAASRNVARIAVIERRRDRSAWAAALAGLTLGLGSWAYSLFTGDLVLDVTSSRIGGIDGFIQVLPATPAVVVLAAGLGLYLVGFFAPLQRTRQRS